MSKVLSSALLTICVLSCFSSAPAQEGGLRGVVLDKATRQPLADARIEIITSTQTAITDTSGAFLIIGIWPGTHALRVSHAQYDQSAQLETRIYAYHDAQVEILLDNAAPQLIPKFTSPLLNYPGTMRLISRDKILSHTTRGLQDLLRFEAGVVQQDGELHVRGGRGGELAYAIEGANLTSPLFRTQLFEAIPEAIAEVQLHSGVYQAELGGGNSGVVQSILQTGESARRFTLDYRTDDFAKPGEQFLNTTAFGYRTAVATLSGPLGNNLRYFIAGEHSYVRDRSFSFVEPFRYANLTEDGILSPSTQPLPDAVAFERNYLPDNWSQRNKVMGNFTYGLGRINLRLSGGYQNHEQPHNSDTFAASLSNYFNRENGLRDLNKTAFAQLHATYALSTKAFLNVRVNHSTQSTSSQDPEFGEDWMKYDDRNFSAHPEKWVSRFEGPRPHSVINAFRIAALGTPSVSFSKTHQSNLSFAWQATSKIHPLLQIKLGGQVEKWQLRRYSIDNIANAMVFLFGFDGSFPRNFTGDYERKVRLARAGRIDNYGYDVDGKILNEGADGPRTPQFTALYAQTKFESQRLTMNLGVRYERIALHATRPKNLEEPAFDTFLNYIDEKALGETEAENFLLPRLSIALPVSPSTAFYLAYGKFVQTPRLDDVYQSLRAISLATSPVTRSWYGFETGQYVGFTARPEQFTQSEFGVRHCIPQLLTITLNYYHKSSKDLLRFDIISASGKQSLPANTPLLTGLLNADLGNSQGLEFTIELKRIRRLAGTLNYAFTSARGTGSDLYSSLRFTSSGSFFNQHLTSPFPLDFNQQHRGALLLDYRFALGEGGKLLQGMGVNLNFSFNSGHNYTIYEDIGTLGSTPPFEFGIRPLRDLRFGFSNEAPNSSTTPAAFQIDMGLDKTMRFAQLQCVLYLQALNLFNRRNVIHVFPTTGRIEDDGWLDSALAASFKQIPGYTDFYRTINLQNHWAYSLVTGNDMYGTPRQIRLGLRLEFF